MNRIAKIQYLLGRGMSVLKTSGFKGIKDGFARFRLRSRLQNKPVDETFAFVAGVDPRTRIELTPPDWPLNDKNLVINFVVPDFGVGSGGHLNIFRTAGFLERFGHTVNIYIAQLSENPTAGDAKRVINDNYVPFKGGVFAGTEDMAPCDAVIATSWQTAYPVYKVRRVRRKFYFIQDYEPMFYPSGSEYVFAENTYRFGYAAITAGPWLTGLMREKYGIESDFYEFAYDRDLYKPENRERKKQILFYARSYTPRRGFELGALALKLVHDRHPDYKIIFIGWPDNPKVSYPVTTLGTLKLSELGPLYNESALALVVSLTNPSLLPPEMMACGLPLVDVRGDNTVGFFGKDTLSLAEADPLSLADAICDLIENPEKRDAMVKRGLEYVEQLDWEKSARTVESILVRDLREVSK